MPEIFTQNNEQNRYQQFRETLKKVSVDTAGFLIGTGINLGLMFSRTPDIVRILIGVGALGIGYSFYKFEILKNHPNVRRLTYFCIAGYCSSTIVTLLARIYIMRDFINRAEIEIETPLTTPQPTPTPIPHSIDI